MSSTFKPCQDCETLEGPKLGFYYVRGNNSSLAIKECKCHVEWRELEQLKIKAIAANLWSNPEFLKYNPPSDYAGKVSYKNVNNLIKFTTHFYKPEFKSTVIYMWGGNGTQKTYLGQWVGLELLRRNYKVGYYLMNQILSKISSSFDSDPEVQAFKNKLLDLDLLIIDEAFSKDKVTLFKSGYQIPFLDSLLRDRIDTCRKSTLFISNNSPDQIEAQGFGKSLQDFILRKTLPFKSVFQMEDSYLGSITNFDVSALFD